MATSDVIRDVGETLVYLLRANIPPAVVPASRIMLATPDDFEPLGNPPQPTITIFLYRVAVNPEMRNSPRRTLPDGRVARPLLPLELGYMITPWARLTTDEHLIAGRVVQVFYDHSELGAADLQGSSWATNDSMQLVLDSMPIEDHYRIWDTTSLPYRLSLTYLARVVGIEPSIAEVVPPVAEAVFGRRMP